MTDDPDLPFDPADVYNDEGYYAVIPEWVLDAEIGALAVRLYAVLRRYADKRTMLAHPSRRTLAARLHVKSLRTVDSAIDELRGIGALSTFRRVTADGDQDSNGYRLHRNPQVNDADKPLQGVVQQTARPRATTPAGGGAADCTTGGAADCTTPLQQTAHQEPQSLDHSQGNHNPPTTSGAPGDTGPAAKAPRKRATRLPEGWEPDAGLAAWTRETFPGFPRSELDRFRDHWKATGGTKADWDATWRNWCREWDARRARAGARGARTPIAAERRDGTVGDAWSALGQQREETRP